MLLPLGVTPFALGLFAVTLTCELYGRRRATVLVWVGLVASLALLGLMRLVAAVDDSDARFGAALALATGCVIAHAVNALIFAALRRRTRGRARWLRMTIAPLTATYVGWIAFGFVLTSDIGDGAPADAAQATALALGSGVCTTACVLLLSAPVAIAAHGLAFFLRVARHSTVEAGHPDVPVLEPVRRRLPPALVVDDEEPSAAAPAARATIQPYSSAELRFFFDGDQLGEPATEP